MYAGQRKYDDAIRCYLEALNKDPYYVPAWHNLGVLYEHLGNDQAAKCFATEKEIEKREQQILAIQADAKRRALPARKSPEVRATPQYQVPVPAKIHPMAGRLCSLGIGLGLVLIVLELKYSGFFVRGSNYSLTGAGIVILSLGVLVSLFSYLVYNRLRYARWCIISPAYTYMLKDRDEPMAHKALIVGIIGTGLVLIPVSLYLLLFRAGVNPTGASDMGIAIITLVIVIFMLSGVDILLSWMLTRMKESNGTFVPSHEQLQVRQSARKKLTFFVVFFGCGILLVTLKSVGVIRDQSVYGMLIVIWLVACFGIFFIYPRFIAGKQTRPGEIFSTKANRRNMVMFPALLIGIIIIVAMAGIFVQPTSSSGTPAVSAAYPRQFTNPGFENGTLAGWTAGSKTSVLGDRRHSGTYSCHFDMSGTPATDYVSQTLDLTNAESITFWGMGESTTWPFYIYLDGTLLQKTNAVPNTWTQYKIPVSGYDGPHTVSVKWNGGPGNYGADVDDFSIT